MAAPLKLGMVGGGQGAFIGEVHRMAARLDGRWQLVAGALASSPTRALASGQELGFSDDRNYPDFASMARAEAGREDRIDAVSIVTPNHVHFPAAKAFLEVGIPVICDKPLTGDLAEAQHLSQLIASTGTPLVLTHNYTGYPMIRQAREMVEAGELGELRLIHVEYIQDWLSEDLEASGQKQASWRTDPARSGAGGAIGDIGTHAFNLAQFVTQRQVQRLSAHLQSFVPGRRLDDNAHVIMDYDRGAKGVLMASQVAPGYENELRLRIAGTKASLEWHQSSANYLRFSPLGQAPQTLSRGGATASHLANSASRIPGGHPEGYLEAFATLYREAADLIGGTAQPLLPTVQHGVDGVQFVTRCVQSSAGDGTWVDF